MKFQSEKKYMWNFIKIKDEKKVKFHLNNMKKNMKNL